MCIELEKSIEIRRLSTSAHSLTVKLIEEGKTILRTNLTRCPVCGMVLQEEAPQCQIELLGNLQVDSISNRVKEFELTAYKSVDICSQKLELEYEVKCPNPKCHEVCTIKINNKVSI